MGQKTNPIGNRLGYIRGWESNWYGGKDFGDKLAEDDKIRKYINIRLARASVSRIPIERTMKMITVTIHTARPGIIIGKGGQEVETLKAELSHKVDRLFTWGPLPAGVASTVVDLTTDEPNLLRPGALDFEEILAACR